MARLTPIPWRKFERFLLSIGCELVCQKGDHRVYERPGLNRPLVIPTEKDIPTFIIRNNLRILSISVRDYLKTVKKL